MRQHNITSAIPRTDQTDPAKFPQYEYQEFPKMLVGKDGKNICNQYQEPIVFQNEEEVDDYLEKHPEVADEIRENAVSARGLEMENDVLKKLLAENERLMKENKKLKSTTEDDEEEETVEASTDDEEPKKSRKKKRRREKPLSVLR